MRVRGLAVASTESFSKRREMLSSPLALPVFSFLMVLRTNVLVTFSNLKLGCDRFISCRVCCLFLEFTIRRVCFMCVTAMVKTQFETVCDFVFVTIRVSIDIKSIGRSWLLFPSEDSFHCPPKGSGVFLVILYILLDRIEHTISHRFICKPVFVERCFSHLP